jgi:hypothetical protein
MQEEMGTSVFAGMVKESGCDARSAMAIGAGVAALP